MTNRAPYVVEIHWRRGNVHFSVRDAAGTVLLDRTVRRTDHGQAPLPAHVLLAAAEVAARLAPAPVILDSFRF